MRVGIGRASQFAESASTGNKSSAARLSATTRITGRSTRRRNRTTIRALAAGESPVTLIRPALSRRWEAARAEGWKLFHLRENVRGQTAKALLIILTGAARGSLDAAGEIPLPGLHG